MTMMIAGVADIGGTNTRVALVDEYGSILKGDRFPTPAGEDPLSISAAVSSSLRRIISESGLPFPAVIGVSVAGPVDLVAGVIHNPPNMPFGIVPIVGPLQHTFGCPVEMVNDCLAAVRGEAWVGAGKAYRHMIYITISTGIGGGVWSDGHALTGRGGNAAEIGHLPVDTTYLIPCSCERIGHWEGYASGEGIPGFFKKWCQVHQKNPDFPSGSAAEIISAAEVGKKIALQFLRELAKINSRGLSAVVVAYDPEIIILDGPVVTDHQDLILTPAINLMDDYLPLPVIKISPLQGNAPLIGAAAAAMKITPGAES
ncbi:MAG TPA: ROK family protein [Methanospirillum sp.]|nr:ROK family protein [Methanospirillum sp.]